MAYGNQSSNEHACEIDSLDDAYDECNQPVTIRSTDDEGDERYLCALHSRTHLLHTTREVVRWGGGDIARPTSPQ